MQRENSGAVSFDCKQDLFRQDVENAGDLRLSVSLLRLCMGEKQVFCPLAEPGAPSVVLHLVVLSCATYMPSGMARFANLSRSGCS